MRGFSKAIIVGNLTRDPELRTTPSGANVCGFSVAVNRVYKDSNGEQKEDVSYIDCSAWNRLGEMISQYAKKGSGVLVSGRLDQRSWEDKNGGGKRSRVEIVVEDFNFVGAPRDAGSGGSYSGSSYSGGSINGSMNNGMDSSMDNSGISNSDANSTPSTAADDTIPDDVPEEEIDLSEVPF